MLRESRHEFTFTKFQFGFPYFSWIVFFHFLLPINEHLLCEHTTVCCASWRKLAYCAQFVCVYNFPKSGTSLTKSK